VSTGQLTQFVLYALMATTALTSLSDVVGSLQTVALDRTAGEILDTPRRSSAPESPRFAHPPLGVVAFDHVDSPTKRVTTSPSWPPRLQRQARRDRRLVAPRARQDDGVRLVQRFFTTSTPGAFWSTASTSATPN